MTNEWMNECKPHLIIHHDGNIVKVNARSVQLIYDNKLDENNENNTSILEGCKYLWKEANISQALGAELNYNKPKYNI